MILSAPELRSDRPQQPAVPGPHEFPVFSRRGSIFGEPGVDAERGSEDASPSPGAAISGSQRPRSRRAAVLVLALGSVVVAAAFVVAPRLGAPRASARPAAGTVVVESQPGGWHIWDGDVDRGVTPLTLVLPAGRRTLVLRQGTAMRELQVEVVSHERAIYHLDLPAPAASGDLHVDTKPAGAIVAVDGIGRGTTPVDVRDLRAGRHVVAVLSGDRIVSESVMVEAGRAASLVVSLDAASVRAPATAVGVGWLIVDAAIELDVYEGESLVGSSRNPKLMFVPGRHVLRLVNRDLNFEDRRTVQVQSASTARVTIPLPVGSLSINATPWAEVWMEGKLVGETPIADYEVPIGSHSLVLRHPTLGERRRTVLVPLGVPARLGVDMRQ